MTMTADDLGRQAYQKLILGEYKEAVNILNIAINKYPDEYKLYINRCYCSIQLGEFTSAMSDASSLTAYFPELPNGFFLKGEIYLKTNKYEEAEKEFKKLIVFDTETNASEVDDKLYECQIQQIVAKGYDSAKARKAIRLAHSTEEALTILASGLIKNGEDEKEISFQLTEEEEEFFIQEFEKLEFGNWETVPKLNKPKPKPAVNKPKAVEEGYIDPLRDPENPGRYCSLWIGSRNFSMEKLSKSVQNELEQLFSQYGKLKNLNLAFDKKCIFVNYFSPEPAGKAMKELQNYNFKGVIFRIEYSIAASSCTRKV